MDDCHSISTDTCGAATDVNKGGKKLLNQQSRKTGKGKCFIQLIIPD